MSATNAIPLPEELEKNSAEIASEQGFVGTFPAFLDWLKDSLIYGGIVVHEPAADQWGHIYVKVDTITAGYSSDERLLGRVQRNILVGSRWNSSSRGGLVSYEIPQSWFEDAEEHEYLAPENDVFERVHRARRVRIYSENGDYVEFSYDAGAELAFQEPERDINGPDGLLIVRPIAPKVLAELGI